MARTRTLFQNSGSAVLPPYQELRINQFLRSPNGRYQLLLQEDSNLVLREDGKVIWVADGSAQYSSTLEYRGKGPTALYVQYGAFLDDPTRRRKWITRPTDFIDKSQWNTVHLVLQNDGNLVEVDYRPVWSTNGSFPQFGVGASVLPAGTELEPGKFYGTEEVYLVFQADGNLVLYKKGNQVVWNSVTYNKGAVRAVFQADGNLVIYNAQGVALWNTGTSVGENAFLQIQNDSIFIMQHHPIWARFGYTPKIKPKSVFDPNDNGYSYTHRWSF